MRTHRILFVLILLPSPSPGQVQKTQYSAYPNHIEILDQALQLSQSRGFTESGISIEDVRDRLLTGVYEEDFASIPGVVGEHFPLPWTQGPQFDFYGLFNVAHIPYGELTDTLSGWARGLSHGYDPLTQFTWPGSRGTTIEWANSAVNTFRWDNAVALYTEGKKAEAYETLGHILHLLMDLSVPAHVKVVNHGSFLSKLGDGSLLNPDIASIVVDEYEWALAGGLEINGVGTIIPDMLGVFRAALATADTGRVPLYDTWPEYFEHIALLTAQLPAVNMYYQSPAVDGEFGLNKDGSGATVITSQLGGPTPPAKIGNRWTQFGGYSTATWPGGTIIPQSVLTEMCDTLVPKAVEYSAGLLEFFQKSVVTGVKNRTPSQFRLEQNYPNPFNPVTSIEFEIPVGTYGRTSLRVYDILGREVAVLVNDVRSPGMYPVEFDGSGLSSGMYFYRLEAAGFVAVRSMVLLR